MLIAMEYEAMTAGWFTSRIFDANLGSCVAEEGSVDERIWGEAVDAVKLGEVM